MLSTLAKRSRSCPQKVVAGGGCSWGLSAPLTLSLSAEARAPPLPISSRRPVLGVAPSEPCWKLADDTAFAANSHKTRWAFQSDAFIYPSMQHPHSSTDRRERTGDSQKKKDADAACTERKMHPRGMRMTRRQHNKRQGGSVFML